jgi:hypothetical protein
VAGDEADPAVPRSRGRQPRLGANDGDHGQALLELRAQCRQRSGSGRVAGDHERLGAPLEQDGGELAREPKQLLGRAVPVREAGGVPEIEEVLMGERHEALVQDREAADARIEDGDWQ